MNARNQENRQRRLNLHVTERLHFAVLALSLILALGRTAAQDPPVRDSGRSEPASVGHHEVLDDPYMPRPEPPPSGIVAARTVVERDGYVSVQVNVDEFGNNIPGDAANEPTIAVDPTNPNRIVIGWRQFNTIRSNFRQAGVGYSHDSGQTWTFPGVLTPGFFRSDPVVVATADGLFHYLSLGTELCGYHCDVFTSTDAGVTWGNPVFAYGGDKAWITADTTEGVGRHNLYQAWTELYACVDGTSFSRSTDRGETFGDAVGGMPRWGTLTVDLNGVLYVSGSDLYDTTIRRSDDAWNPTATPTFSAPIEANLGGSVSGWGGPNPEGLTGQIWIRSDRSNGPYAGDVYLLASVHTGSNAPTEVMFARSEDGGFTWSAPVRVNDDPAGTGAWHWFGTMDVAPNGRIDAIWNDTRNSGQENLSELYYAFSTDGGRTFSSNVPICPMFDSFIGWPRQNKIGDYYGMVSDNTGASIAYAATFNGEQDVYFLRIGMIDCNENGWPDEDDIADGRSNDCNGDGLPDECGADCNHNHEPDVCEIVAGAPDCDGNGWLDSCQWDLDGDGLIDNCDDDTDDDGVPNGADACPRTPVHGPADADGFPRFSTEGDCFVGLWDYWRFYNCVTGTRPDVPPPWDACYEHFDADDNGELNLRDFAAFQNGYTGP